MDRVSKIIRRLISRIVKKPLHEHNLLEIGLTDECDHGCKVLACSCNYTVVSHRRIYGCPFDISMRQRVGI